MYNKIQLSYYCINIIQSPAVCIWTVMLPVPTAVSSINGYSEQCNPAHFLTRILALYLK